MSERSLFIRALEIDDPAQRSILLDRECGDDDALRRRIEKLLSAHTAAGGILDKPPSAVLPSPFGSGAGDEGGAATDLFRPITEGPGTIIGPYKLLQQIGEGGFGVVYMAEQQRPVRRKVALKIIKPGMDTREVIARFESERQALALMDHPNIARVLDGGTTDSGRPYFVMELVKGVPLTQFCDDNKLDMRQRLGLFATVCKAIQHAHHKGVIHRDIKPSNVMVTLHDGQPVPKVIDFGVSKAISQQLTEKTMFTAYGQMIGTPAYMSPEQAEMSGLDIDTRSDVYSLGVLLYELLTGSTPLGSESLRGKAYAELQRMIREDEPQRPSLRVSTLGEATVLIASQRGTVPRELGALLRGELDWIVMKALEKNRDRRYESANNFAADVERFLKHEAIEACPPSTLYRVRKFVRRNRAACTTGGLIAISLLIATLISISAARDALYNRRLAEDSLRVALADRQQAEQAQKNTVAALQTAERERDRAEQAKAEESKQRAQAEQQRLAAEVAEKTAATERTAAVQQRDKATAASAELAKQKEQQRRLLYVAQMNLIQTAWNDDNIPWMRDLLNSVRPQPEQEDLRGFEWHYWHRLANSDLHSQSLEPLRSGRAPAFSADGSLIAEYVVASPSTTNSNNPSTRSVRIWNTASGQQVGLLTLPASNLVPQARIASALTGNSTDSVELWLSPDGRRVAVSYPPGTPLTRTRGESQTLTIQIYDIGDANPMVTIHETGIWDSSSNVVMFSGDANRVAVLTSLGGQGGDPSRETIKIWDTASGNQIAAIATTPATEGARGTSPRISSLAINTDGSRVATFDGSSITIWDVASQEVVNRIDSGRAIRLKFSPDGQKLVARVISGDGSEGFRRMQSDIKIWDINTGAETASFAVAGLIVSMVHSPDGKWLAFLPIFANAIRSVQLFSADTGKPGPQFKGHAGGVVAIAFSPDSSRLLTAADDGAIKQWDIAAAVRAIAPSQIPIKRFASPRGGIVSAKTLLAVSSDGATYAIATRLPQPPELASPEDAAANCRHIALRRTGDDTEVRTIEMAAPIASLISSRGGGRFAAVACAISGELSQAAQVGVWDAATGSPVMPPLTLPVIEGPYGPSPGPLSTTWWSPEAALSPDGKLLACSVFGGTGAGPLTALKIIEVDTQRVVALGDNLPGQVIGWSFSPDGSRILGRVGRSTTSTRFIVYESRTAQKLWSHATSSQAVTFSADSTQVYAYTTPAARLPEAGGAMQIWDAATGQQFVQFSLPYDSRSSVKACLSPDGKQLATTLSATFSLGARGAGIVEVWDVASRTVMCTLHGHTMPIVSIAYSPDGRRIVTSSGRTFGGQAGTGETMLWDAQTGHELVRLGDGTGNLTFTPDGRQLFGDNADLAFTNIFQRWDASPLSPEREVSLLVEAFLSKPSGQGLPLKSEALTQIDADLSLSDSVRAAARRQVRAIRRSASELNQAGWLVVRLPGQAQNEYERALRYLEEALDTDPTSCESWSNRALAHYRLDQPSEALAALARCQELHTAQQLPSPAEDLTILAMSQHQSGRHDEARRSLDKAHAAASRNEPAWRKLFTEAETLLAVSSERDAPQRWIGRKVMHRPNAGWDVLPIVVSKAEGNLLFTGSRWIEKSQVVPLEDAEAYYTHLLQLEPGNAWAHNLRGAVRGQQGDRDKELEDYNAAIRYSPGGDQGISAFRNRGQWWERKGSVANALRDYQEVIRLDPHDRSALYRRAGLLQRSGKLDEALKDYDEVIRIDPNYAAAYANRGLAWQQKGDLDRAIQDYDEAIRLNPKYATAYSYRASVHQHFGNRDKALADLQQVIELTPGPAAAPHYRTRGDLRLAAQDHKLAIQDYTEAIRLAPVSADAHNNLAWLLATCPEQDIRDGKKSVEHATKACELEKWQSPISLDTLAAAYAETGNFSQAIKYQEQSLTLAHTDAQKAEGDSHLALYREGKPYRERPTLQPTPPKQP